MVLLHLKLRSPFHNVVTIDDTFFFDLAPAYLLIVPRAISCRAITFATLSRPQHPLISIIVCTIIWKNNKSGN